MAVDELPDQARAEERGYLGLGWGIYHQIAAVLGGFSLLAFLSHFVDMDWQGFLGTLVNQWYEIVRPPVSWLLDVLIVKPALWLGWRLEIPLIARDYVAVGLVLVGSNLRAFGAWAEVLRGWHPVGEFKQILLDVPLVWRPVATLVMLIVMVPVVALSAVIGIVLLLLLSLAWPLLAVLSLWTLASGLFLMTYGRAVWRTRFRARKAFVQQLLAISPLLYFAVLLAVNQFIL